MKKIVWSLVFFLIIGVAGFIILEKSRTTTYGEVITKLMDEDDRINKVYIQYYSHDDRKEMTLTDADEINKIMELPSDMTIKRKNNEARGGAMYFITVSTNKASLSIIFNTEGGMTVDKNNDPNHYPYDYQIIGENILFDVIESLEDKWKSLE